MLMGKLPGTLTSGLEEERLMNLCKHWDKHSYVIESTLLTCTLYKSARVKAPFEGDTEAARQTQAAFSQRC